MAGLVKKWGNSAAVRIPASVLADAQMELNQTVAVREEHGRIVIEAIRPIAFSIGALVDEIRPGNLHEPLATGTPVGREVW